MGTYIFLQLFGMACKLHVVLNTDTTCDPSRFDYSTVILFLTRIS